MRRYFFGSLLLSLSLSACSPSAPVPLVSPSPQPSGDIIYDGTQRTAQDLAWPVSTFVGSQEQGYVDGPGDKSRFRWPSGLTIDSQGNLYVCDTGNHAIRKIAPDGFVTTIAGGKGEGHVDGPREKAKLWSPDDVALGADGSLFVVESINHCIRKISSQGEVTTLAGSGMKWPQGAGYVDGPGEDARFLEPRGLCADGQGGVFVADRGNHRIRKVTSEGVVTTYAGSGVTGFKTTPTKDGRALEAEFYGPSAVALDGKGNLYVAGGLRIRRISADGWVTNVAGNGSIPGPGTGGIDPRSLTFTADGRLLAVSAGAAYLSIVRVSDNGGIAWLLMPAWENPAARTDMFTPSGMVTSATGDLCVNDSTGNRIRRLPKFLLEATESAMPLFPGVQ